MPYPNPSAPQYFLLSLSLSFLPPARESSSGFSSAFRRLGFSSVVGFVRLLLSATVFSLVLCHDAVFGWSVRPSSVTPFLDSAIWRMQSPTAKT